MGGVVWHVTMSLDGFIAGPDDAMAWAFEHGAASPMADEVMATTGAILGGRRWYDVATEKYAGVDGIYGGAWAGPVFVLTHHPPREADPRVTFLTDGIADAVATAGDAAAGGNVELFGANLAQQALRADLLDEILIPLAPVLLGDGIRLYDHTGADPVVLERTLLEPAGQTTDLRFRVPKGKAGTP